MANVNYFIDLFVSIPDYTKIILLMLLIQNDKDLLTDVDFKLILILFNYL